VSSDPARNVIFRSLVRWIGEDFLRSVKLDQFPHQEKSREFRDPRGLLRIMDNDNDGKPLFQLENQILDFAVEMGSRAEAGSSMSITSRLTANARALQRRCC
jgi:hypothetical protein